MKRLLVLVTAATALGATPAQEPDLGMPDVSLRIETDRLWNLVVTNRGAVPLRLMADGRLLRLEVQAEAEPAAKGKKKRAPVTCRLPAAMRPGSVSEDRAVVLAPGARYEEPFEPELYCFGKAERTALAAGTKLVPKLGFDVPRRKAKVVAPPFVAEPTSLPATVQAIKEIVGEPFVVPPKQPAPPVDREAAADPGAPRLVVETPARLDAADADSVELTVRVKNAGKRAALVRLRRDNILFDMVGPTGWLQCGVMPGARTIPRDLYGSLAGGGAESLTVRLVEPCPDNALGRPGLYRILARLVVPDSGERTPSVRPWIGQAIATEPTLVRVQTGELPFHRSAPVTTPTDR